MGCRPHYPSREEQSTKVGEKILMAKGHLDEEVIAPNGPILED